MKKPNGTDARTIALYFLDHTTDGRYTPIMIAKSVNQAKSLLSSGFTKEEAIQVIDYLISKNINMYSLGYVNACIGEALKEVKKLEIAELARIEKQKLTDLIKVERSEVKNDDESTERNRSKALRFSVQSRLREKHHLDLFEGK